MLVILDWDGTLADSRELIVTAMQNAAAEQALPVPEDNRVASLIGLGLSEVMLKLFPRHSDEARSNMHAAYSRFFVEASVAQGSTRFFPGVVETLDQLRSRGHDLAVATGKSRRGLDRVLSVDSLQNTFLATRAADETRSKPHPLMLQELLEETSTALEDAVMVGDTSYDMQMAESIGMQRIAVSYGVHSRDELQRFQPVMTLDRFEQLLEWQMLS